MKFALLCAMSCLLVAMSATTATAEPKFGQIKHQGACLTAPSVAALETPSLSDDALTFRVCKHSDMREHWFYTPGRRPGDDTSKNGARNIRNMAHPAYCLGSANARRSGTTMRLERCDGTKSQQWVREPESGDDWMQSAYDTCAKKIGTELVVAECEKRDDSLKFEFEFRNVVRNADLAEARADFPELSWPTEHAFNILADCQRAHNARSRDRECYMKNNFFDDESGAYDSNLPPASNALDGLMRSSVTFRYGFSTGPGHSGTTPLTLGNRNTLDRCAKGHDINIWGDAHFHSPSASNDANFVACLANSVPFSVDDRKALNRAHNYYKDQDSVALPVTAACARQSRGHMPGFDARLPVCICQLIELAGTRIGGEDGRCVLSGAPYDTQTEACTIREGDFLSLLEHASDHGSSDLCETSLEVVADWQDAQVGAELAAEAERLAQPRPHIVSTGDWIWRLAQRDNAPDIDVYVADFEALNDGVDANLVYIGRTYILPPVVIPAG